MYLYDVSTVGKLFWSYSSYLFLPTHKGEGIEYTSEMGVPTGQKEAGRRDYKLNLGSQPYRGLVFITFIMIKHHQF
jgi:hypothetical protein